MGGYAERAENLEKGRQSEYFLKLMDYPQTLCEEQYGLMALICEKLPEPPTDAWLASYVNTVATAQALMPGGTIRSRQMLVMMAMLCQE